MEKIQRNLLFAIFIGLRKIGKITTRGENFPWINRRVLFIIISRMNG